jgi:D-3-phosphoglycerate dehydrogenase / 2-oxoglutarate reductase
VIGALVTAALTTEAAHELEQRFGWALTTLPRGARLGAAGDGYDPAAVNVLVIEAEPLDAATLDAFPALSLVACLRGNPVNVDLEHATARSIPVVHAPGRNAESVADLALGLILSCTRHIARSHHLIVSRALTEDRDEVRVRKDVVWRPSDKDGPVPYLLFKGPELSRLTLGLLGFGAVGRRLGAKARALEMHVLAHDPFVADAEIVATGVEPVSLARLLAETDVLSLHAPSQSGAPLMGRDELAAMKHSAYLINTARASVLDYDALTEALQEGRLAGAGLDVFPDEPLSSHSPLLELANVTLTPHIGGASSDVVEHQSKLLLRALRALAAGEPMDGLVKNPLALHGVDGGIPAALRGSTFAPEADTS